MREFSHSARRALVSIVLGASAVACVGPHASEAPSSSPGDVAPVPPRVAGPASDAGHDFTIPPPLSSEESSGDEGAGAAAEPEEGTPVHGAVIARYHGRSAGDASDHDLYATLLLDVGDAERQPWTAHVMGRVAGDLDGSGGGSQQLLPSLADTWDSSVTGLLYTAYADYSRSNLFERVRIGRQLDYETPEFAYFDGASVETRPKGDRQLRAGVYGGVPVHLYESSASGDRILGAWGEGKPWQDARMRLDWMHVRDERTIDEFNNDLLGVALWQKLRDNVRVDAQYTRLEQENRDLRLRAFWDDAKSDFSLQLSWYRLLEEQRGLAAEFDPFTDSLQDYFPYSQFGLLASKGVGENVQLQAGADVRRVTDDGDVGTFNRDYERGYLSTTFEEVLPSLALTLTGDVWDSDERVVHTWGLDLTRQFSRGLKASAGSYYSLFKFDAALGDERDDVRTYFIKLCKQHSKSLSFDIGYDYEDADFESYQVLTLGTTWRF